MQINNINNTSISKPNFQKIYTGLLLKREIKKPDCPKSFVNKYVHYLNLFTAHKMRKTKNVNFNFDYTKEDGFHMYIVAKDNIHILSNTPDKYFKHMNWSEDCMNRLKGWILYWDKFYENVDTTFK